MGNTSHYHTTRKQNDDKTTEPWNNWYHVTIHVYGSWLRGDPRGWRSRHHREHVDGDYKNPPPKGKYDNLYELSKALMKRDPVKIERELRQFVADAIAEKLRQDGIEVLIVSVDAKHVHVLARFPDRTPDTGLAVPRNTRRTPSASRDCARKKADCSPNAVIRNPSRIGSMNSRCSVIFSTTSSAGRGCGGLIGLHNNEPWPHRSP